MGKFDRDFMEKIKNQLDVELLGIVSLPTSTSDELKRRAISILPEVKSVVVLGKEIFREVVSLLKPRKEVGEAEYGELLGPHSDFLSGRLTGASHHLANLFRREGYRSLPLPAVGCPTDQRFMTALFSYKHAGELAGLGKIGRHSLLITPEFGPRVRLACVLTEAPLESSHLAQKDYCAHCDVCIRECPAQALAVPEGDEAYSMDKFACRTYRQAGLTCSVCMKVCDEALGSGTKGDV
jgi:epoxyqueuosine reductase